MAFIWPRDRMVDKLAFYGDPRAPKNRAAWESKNLVRVTAPYVMRYDGVPVGSIRVHRKCADAFNAAFAEIWDHCGQDQKAVDKAGAGEYNGCYFPRLIRGSETEWSNHTFACAIDLSGASNGFNMKSTLSMIVIGAFKQQGARWGGDYKHRTDPMHFEFVSPA